MNRTKEAENTAYFSTYMPDRSARSAITRALRQVDTVHDLLMRGERGTQRREGLGGAETSKNNKERGQQKEASTAKKEASTGQHKGRKCTSLYSAPQPQK